MNVETMLPLICKRRPPLSFAGDVNLMVFVGGEMFSGKVVNMQRS